MTDRVLQAKAEALQRCLATVAEGVPPPTTMGESFDRLAETGRIDWAVVHALATARLAPPTRRA